MAIIITGNSIEDNITSDDKYMCNVIYDLKGTIPIIPVVNGKALLEIKSFIINPKSRKDYLYNDKSNKLPVLNLLNL